MGHERQDRGHNRDRGYRPRASERPYEDRGDDRFGRSGGERDRQRGYSRPPQDYDHDDRGFFDRAGDELRSWFGDEEAERRRRYDERYAEREHDRDRGRYADRGDRGPERWDSAAYHAPGDYGRGVEPGAGHGWSFREQYRGGRSHEHDPHYREWRDRQMEAFDRDYAEYRRENQSRFESDFGAWRETRQGQRQRLAQVREHHEVVGSDGTHLGTVDKVQGDRILLTRTDQQAGGHHHSIPCSWVARVADKVELSKTAEQAQAAWRDEERQRRGGPQEDDRSEGPHILDRSFSGTY